MNSSGQSFTTVVPPEYHDTLRELHDRFIAGEKELDAEVGGRA